ncbi:hypothetical protein [Rhizobium fabae]|jgi:hypothetical protein|uniref:Uncharacterized protein n=1 Tax=Rhizobium fabae TaxID=573179 RepID=A0A7W6BBY8_9HYPH|nr:hypothetical protein [Rhizobium fabae]MBB3919465.1 hypothetical protein [Rhizobium fabae]
MKAIGVASLGPFMRRPQDSGRDTMALMIAVRRNLPDGGGSDD